MTLMTSYLHRVPISRASRSHCYYCAAPLYPGMAQPSQTRATKDHVLPKAAGFNRTIGACIGVLNLRPCCARCNSLRGELHHCCGALMLGLIEADHQRKNLYATLAALGLRPQRKRKGTP